MTTTTLTLKHDAKLEPATKISKLERLTPIAGRGLLSAIFLMSAAGKAGNFAGTAAMMATRGFPAASLFLASAIALEVCGGLSILTGYKAKWGALALIFFLIPATFIFHNFWAYTGADLEGQMVHFLKNLAIMGGLVTTYVAASKQERN
jgi:putative oxidoreductase